MAKLFAVRESADGGRVLELLAESTVTLTKEGATLALADGRVVSVSWDVLEVVDDALRSSRLLRSAAAKVLGQVADADERGASLVERKQLLATLKKTARHVTHSKLESFDSKEERELRACDAYDEIKATLESLVAGLRDAVRAQRGRPRRNHRTAEDLVDELLVSQPLPGRLSWADHGKHTVRVREWLIDLDASEALMSRVRTNELALELAARECRSTPAAVRDAMTSARKRRPQPKDPRDTGFELLSRLPRNVR